MNRSDLPRNDYGDPVSRVPVGIFRRMRQVGRTVPTLCHHPLVNLTSTEERGNH